MERLSFKSAGAVRRDRTATTAANRPSEPADWATDLAITIIAEVQSGPYNLALNLLAARLRHIKAQGEFEAAKEAQRLMADAISREIAP